MTERNIEFEWDKNKVTANLRKHGVEFEEAETAFDDEFARIFQDEEHSDEEPREILIGLSKRNRLLVISFVQRAHDRIRIISARLPDREERQDYEEQTRF